MTLSLNITHLIRTIAVSTLIGVACIACSQSPSAEVAEVSEVAEVPKVPETTKVTEATNFPKVSETTKVTEVSEDSEVKVTIDIEGESRQISEQIYGVSVSGGARPYFSEVGVSVVRWGGNARTRFNWEINATNSGADWEFRNNPKGDDVPGSAALIFHSRNITAGAESLLSIPMIGWVARDDDPDSRSIDAPGDGQSSTAYDPTDNRERTSFVSMAQKRESFEYPPNLNDDAVYQDEWVHYLTTQIGDAANGGIGFYELDNEPMIWWETHGDVQPDPLGYEDYFDLFAQYSEGVKFVDPTAKVMAPSVFGWTHYFHSALDRGDDNFGSKPDRSAHLDTPFLEWFLAQAQAQDEASGTRSLDYLSIHYYPQNGVFSKDTSAEIQARRLASTRSLWDSDYEDDSWISRDDDGPIVRLIPRMREWIDGSYPGTKLAITEWDWGANDHISGGLAAADVLGIFGSEGVDLATHWGNIKEDSPVYWAYRIYRNYDGDGNGFGDLSIDANTNSPETISVHASKMSDTGQTKVILINKSPDQPADVRLEAIIDTFQVYRYGETSVSGIERIDNITITQEQPFITLPPYSMTLLVSE